MHPEKAHHPDFGTGEKKLGLYIWGIVICVALTLVAFAAVHKADYFSKFTVFTIIYTAAVIQFLVQVIFFLRLNVQTTQSKINVMSLLFTAVIMFCIVIGSLWIMYNLDFNMMH